MKILHLIDIFDARYERDQVEIVKFLERKGYDITLITSRYCDDGLTSDTSRFRMWERKFSKAEILHMPSFRIPIRFFSGKAVTVYLPPTSTIVSWDYDIVHAYNWGSYSSFLSTFFKKLKKTRVVLRSDLNYPTYERAKNIFLYKKLLMKPLKMVDAVYSFTNKEAEWLVDLGVPKEKIFVIPVGVDYEKFCGVCSNPEVTKVLTIGYIGRLLPGKGVRKIVSPLLRLLKSSGKIKVVFAGPKTDVNYADDIIGKMETDRNFQYVNTMEAVQFFRMCDIVIAPSIGWESGLKVVLEAMAAGKAVVASNIHPAKEYIRHGYSGFLFDSDDQLYALGRNLIENPYLISRIGENARKEAAKYDWKVIIGKVEKIYESVLPRN